MLFRWNTQTTTVGTVKLSLENHYILSANGIDENYGKADYMANGLNRVSVSKKAPVIEDKIARTPGASDVNMYSDYTIYVSGGKIGNYRLNTTVKYLDIDKINKKIKVGHSWKLTKM